MRTAAVHASERQPLARLEHDDQGKFEKSSRHCPNHGFGRASHRGWVALRYLVTVPLLLGLVMPATATGAVAGALRPGTATVQLTGAGSTFDAPFFDAAFRSYEKVDPGVSVSYAAVGSSQGVDRFSFGTVDFGASDVPMTASQAARASGGPVVQVPIDLGAVVVSYNLGNYTLFKPLRLTGAVLARIYLGQITNWDDPAIKALNPADQLPDQEITVVHRSDGSGTTYRVSCAARYLLRSFSAQHPSEPRGHLSMHVALQ